MHPALAEALAKRGRRWGQANDATLAAVRAGKAPVRERDRPHVAAYTIDRPADRPLLQRVLFSGRITRIAPAP